MVPSREPALEASSELDAVFAALADPTRRRVIHLLGMRPHRAGEIAEAFEMSRPAMSRHLRVLRTNGLVEEAKDENDARGRVYRLRPQSMDGLRDWVAEVQNVWEQQLDSFRTHTEKRGKSS